MEFSISSRAKNVTFALMILGMVATIVGFFGDNTEHHQRFWSNLLVNGFFFFAISLGALFFLSLQYAAEVAWGTVLKRVFEAVMGYLPVGSAILILFFLAATFGFNHSYEWMDSHHVEHDEILQHKSTYLNPVFFWIRNAVYFTVFILFARAFRKRSLLEDQVGGTELHFKNYRKGATFLVLFAVFSSTLAWDWLMSLEPHWFSTLYGWYVFSGMWVTAIITFIMLTLYLKSKGHLNEVNENHLHDLGKWMFAISFLWSYLWFFQMQLIWYANIPEEVSYYQFRNEHYKFPYYFMFVINFALPMLVLMSRDAKRNYKLLMFVGLVIFFGHWLDVFVMVMPGTVKQHWQFGLLEIGMFLMFLGLFIFVVLRELSKAPLVPKNHPYLEESIHHQF
jgi:hypothetical protein